MTRRLATALAVLACTALAPAGARPQDAGAATPPACDAEPYRQFDFWVGDWEVRTADGALAGTNRIEKILNGCVLLEHWTGAGGSVGKSFNMYYERDGTWRQTWVDGSGGRLDLRGGLEGGDMVLAGEMPARDGGSALHEVRWTHLEDGRIRQHWRVSRDGGATWQDVFLGFYSRK